jgi:putative heme-binding domain-containing protein
LLTASLSDDTPPLVRRRAAELLGRAKLDATQRKQLVAHCRKAGPVELPLLIAAFDIGGDAALGQSLVNAVGNAPGFGGLTADALTHALARFPAPIRDQAKPHMARLNAGIEQRQARLAVLEKTLPPGSASRGRVIYLSARTACNGCHVAENRGSRIGPDLSKIGGMRGARDLLEAIVFPSASMVRGYEPYTLALADGSTLAGLIERDTGNDLLIRLADQSIRRVPRGSIEQLRPSTISVMPQGFDGQLSPQELADLVAYLQSLK